MRKHPQYRYDWMANDAVRKAFTIPLAPAIFVSVFAVRFYETAWRAWWEVFVAVREAWQGLDSADELN